MEAKTNPWGSVVVKTVNGESLQLASRWQNQKTVLYLVRRFGCVYCQHQGSVIMELKRALDLAGVSVSFVAVGGGNKWASDKFKYGTPWDGEVLLDGPHAAHKAMGLQRFSKWQAMRRYYLSPKALSFSRGLYGRFGQADYSGDQLQSGGVFILGPGTNSVVEYSFIESEHSPDAACDVPAMYKVITGKELDPEVFGKIHSDQVKVHNRAAAQLQSITTGTPASAVAMAESKQRAQDGGPSYAAVQPNDKFENSHSQGHEDSFNHINGQSGNNSKRPSTSISQGQNQQQQLNNQDVAINIPQQQFHKQQQSHENEENVLLV